LSSLVKGVGEELEEHLLECPHREVPCPESGCEDRIRFSELENHLATAPDHELVQAEPTKYWFTVDMEADWGRVVQQIGGVTFYEQVVVRGGTWYAWVQVVGGAREAANWSCDVLVETESLKVPDLSPGRI